MASCDRGDIGGLSTAVGPDGLPSVFVYDGYPGGAGFAERGFRKARTWLGATAAAIEACECPSGCPSCVQSPKCGNGNDPLDKAISRCDRISSHLDEPHAAGRLDGAILIDDAGLDTVQQWPQRGQPAGVAGGGRYCPA